MSNLITEITDTDKGVFIVETSSGSNYVVDMNNRTLNRQVQAIDLDEIIPSGVSASDRGAYLLNEEQSRLRNDNSPIQLVNVLRCNVGEHGLFILSGLAGDPNIITSRNTTEIKSITKID